MIEVSEKTIDRIHTLLTDIQDADKKVLKPAMARALMAGKTEAKRQAVQVYHIKAGEFNKNSYIKYNGIKHHAEGEMIGEISFAGSPVPLMKYKVTPETPAQGATAAAAALKSNAPVPFNRENDVHVLQMKSGHIGIFKGGGGRLKELYGPSTPRMAGNEEVRLKVEQRVNEVLNQRAEHEIERLLDKYGGR